MKLGGGEGVTRTPTRVRGVREAATMKLGGGEGDTHSSSSLIALVNNSQPALSRRRRSTQPPIHYPPTW
jgi:hypothetical protein